MTPRLVLPLAIVALFMAGCAGRPPPSDGEATLHPIDAPGLARVLEGQRGKVVLVDFWATWCGPCLELFPHTVALQRRFGERGLVVITVSLDDPAHLTAVGKFLGRNGATLENFFSLYGVGPAAFTAFGIDDGALPHVRVYDRQGKLRQTFSSGGKAIDPKEMERLVEAMME